MKPAKHISGFAFLGLLLVAGVALAFYMGDQLALDAVSAEKTQSPVAQTEPKPVQILGFRSARFGMDEAQVRAAIAKDFGIGEARVLKSLNEKQKTTILRIMAPRLNPKVPDHPTIISYILGHETEKLIQINLTWGTDLTPGLSWPDLNTKAALYRRTLLSLQFDREKTRTDGLLRDGSRLLFTSEDQEGHSVLLRAKVVQIERQADTNESEQTASASKKINVKRLLLSYIANQKNPEIFRAQ